MRIIAGTKKGFILETMKGETTRPTTDKVREAVMSILSHEISGADCLDLFAGSGLIGIELLSRGASQCTFTENNSKAMSIIKKNINKTGFDDKSIMIFGDAIKFVKSSKEEYDIVYCDPPYEMTKQGKTMEVLSYRNLLKNGGTLFIEHDLKDIESLIDKSDMKNHYLFKKNRSYGRIILSEFWRK